MYRSPLLPFLIFICVASCKNGDDKSVSCDNSIIADSGIVVSANHISSEIGVRILKHGGNAIDAAVATDFALAVCYPEAGNIGGGGFMLIRTNNGTVDVIDYRERSSMSSTQDMFLGKDGNVVKGLSTESHLASGIPGTVDGLVTAHKKYGKLPFSVLVQPAIDLAENGFIISSLQAEDLNQNRENFKSRNKGRTDFVKDSGWKEGDTLIQKNLAETLKRIRDFGRDGFYKGKTAKLIVKEMKRGGGIISKADLESYKSNFRTPLSSYYRGYKIITVPPPSGGGILLLQLLGMIEPYSIAKSGFNSPETVHLITEAEKRAFADRSEYSGDPDYMKADAKKLIDKSYLKARMSTIIKSKATPVTEITPGKYWEYESMETTHYSVVDFDGNAVSVTTTLNNTFGSSIVVDSAGFLLNNQMDDFSVKAGYPNLYGLAGGVVNSVQPGKKMLSSMTPTIVEKNGKLFLVLGSPGGSTIPTSVFQVVINVLDFGMNIKNAVDASRFHNQLLPDRITYEKEAFDSIRIGNLTDMGYFLKSVSSIGRVNAVMILPDNRKAGGADKRGDNSAVGY
jgi:gamma-glutamyltranspeptidase / glutathione hydrolase